MHQTAPRPWTVYLLRNERNALYTGITNNLPRRLHEHRERLAKGARYTRACRVLDLVYNCEVGTRSTALKIELKIKKLTKTQKESLVAARPEVDQLLELLA